MWDIIKRISESGVRVMKLKIGSLGLFDDYHNSSLILVRLLTYKLGRLGKNCVTL